MTTSITPIKRSDSAALMFLKGARLLGVTYHYFPSTVRKGYIGGNGVDDELTAVVLDLGDHGRMAFTWAMVGELEGLAVFKEESLSEIAIEKHDAAQCAAWHQHIGHSIISIAASWQVSGENCPESLWAVRICFAEGSIVVALGRANPDIKYMPNELVVIFDSSLAQSYRPPHVNDSSWGVPI
jgi:hypothetical protein